MIALIRRLQTILRDRWDLIYLRGATAHEFQIGEHVVRIVHLKGGYFNWKFWRRISYRRYPKDKTC